MKRKTVCAINFIGLLSLYENLVKSKVVISDGRFQQKLNYSLGSLSEVRSFLDICVMENYLIREEYLILDKEAGEIQEMLIEAIKFQKLLDEEYGELFLKEEREND